MIQWILIGIKVIELIQRRNAEKKEITADDLKIVDDRKDRIALLGIINSDLVGYLVEKYLTK